MATITLNYNARNSKALKLLEYIRSLDFIKIEEESYDDDFVKKIEQSRKEVREGKVCSHQSRRYNGALYA